MKQLFFNNKCEILVEEVPPPVIQDGGILVKTGYSLISSGTESTRAKVENSLVGKVTHGPELVKKVTQHIMSDGLKETAILIKNRLKPPLQLNPTGYSAAGIVLETGKAITDIEVGERVACAGGGYASHAEIIYTPRNLLVKIPDGVQLKEAAFTTLGSIAIQGIRRAKVEFGETIVVVGLGLVGQLVNQILHLAGCRVIGIEPVKAKLELAKKMGIEQTILLGETDPVGDVMEYTDGIGADAVIICAATPSSEPVNQAFKMCRDKGRVAVVGAVGMNLERPDFYNKELDFFISRSYGPGRYDEEYEEKGIDYPIGYVRWTENRNMQEFVKMLAEKKVDALSLISYEYPIEKAQEAYDKIAHDSQVVAVLFKYSLECQKEARLQVSSSTTQIVRETESKEGTVKVAVIGTGSIAQNFHLPNLKKIKGYEIRAIVSGKGHNAKQASLRYGAAYCTTDYKEVLEDKDIDMVLIATRHNLHKPIAIDAAKAKKNIFVEKPLGMTIEECLSIKEAIVDNDVLLTVGFNRRFSPFSIKAKELLEQVSGPKMIIYKVNAGILPRDHWINDPIEGGGRIIGEACHFFDLLYWFVGEEPVSIYAEKISSNSPSIIDDDNIMSTISFANGSLGTFVYTCIGDISYPKERIEIFGDGKVIVIDDFRELVVNGFKKEKGFRSKTVDKGHYHQFKEFHKALTGIAPLKVTVDDGVRAMFCAVRALESSNTGAKIVVRERNGGVGALVENILDSQYKERNT